MLSREETAFVGRQRVAHLATADGQGRPQVVPVCFVYVQGRFYTPIDEKPKRSLRLRRLRNIAENAQAALVFDRYEEEWDRLGYVLVRGRASLVEAAAEREQALAALREKYPQYRSMALEGRPLVRIDPQKVSSWGELAGERRRARGRAT